VHLPERSTRSDTFLPLAVIYADKRVKHDRVVDISERFEDL
jgi:hypothetical protein